MDSVLTKIIEQAEKNGLTRFGVRQHHVVVNVSDELGVSYNSLDDMEPEELSGICCLKLLSYDGFDVEGIESDLVKLKQYPSDGSTILVGGTGSKYGNDQDEIIIENAVVLHVFLKKTGRTK